MSDNARSPGPVQEKAQPIGKPVFKAAGTSDDEVIRQPGPVNARAEAITEDRAVDSAGLDSPKIFYERSAWNTAIVLVVLSASIWLIAEVIISIIALYEYSIYLAIPALLLFIATLVAIGWAGHREYVALRSLDRLDERRENLRNSALDNDWPLFWDEIEPILKNIGKREPELIQQYRDAIEDGDSVADVLTQFENIVLTKLDQEIEALTRQTMLASSVGVAASPHPALDAVLIIWQGQRMTRKIGTIYGLEPTGLSAWRLMRHTLMSAVLAAGIEELGEVALEKFLEGPAMMVVKPLVEGSVTARRMYRLGAIARSICRPLSK